MSADERPTLEVGRIIKAHGLRGQVIVDLWTDRDERLNPGTVLATDRGPLTVISSARHAAAAHQSRFIVTFDGVSERDDAERWRGVVLRAKAIEDEDVIWIHELFNAEVVDVKGVVRGKVVDVESNPASDILVLDTGALVPLVFVVGVEANVRIDIDAPEGLFE